MRQIRAADQRQRTHNGRKARNVDVQQDRHQEEGPENQHQHGYRAKERDHSSQRETDDSASHGERNAKRENASTEDIFDAKYAFCAAVDEAILSSQFSIRDEWERQPLQLLLFGVHLAGEQYFDKLEELRRLGAPRVQALEIFYHCLLHGFRGKYLLEGPEKLNYLIARVGDEVAYHKGKRAGFAPNWAIPDRVRHALNNEIPIWVIACVMAMMAVLGYVGLHSYLGHQTASMLAPYVDIFKAAPRPAHVNITLP